LLYEKLRAASELDLFAAHGITKTNGFN